MPLPTPNANETEETFISRCMEDLAGEFPEQDQRTAVCYRQWRGEDKEIKTEIVHKTLPVIDIKSDKNVYDFIISSEIVDVDKDIIKIEGINSKDYERNPVVLWAHDHGIPAIGKCTKLMRSEKNLTARVEFAPIPPDWKGDWFPDAIKWLVDQKYIKAVSVGIDSAECRNPTSKDKEIYGSDIDNVISKCRLHEFSICNVGANPGALALGLQDGIQKGIFTKTIAANFGIEIKDEIKKDVIENISKIKEGDVPVIVEKKIETRIPIIIEKKIETFIDTEKVLIEIKKELARRTGKVYIDG
jgi:hypothetical protein